MFVSSDERCHATSYRSHAPAPLDPLNTDAVMTAEYLTELAPQSLLDLRHPIRGLESIHTAEVLRVVRDQRNVQSHGMGGDQRIEAPDGFPVRFQSSAKSSEHCRRYRIKWFHCDVHGERVEQAV